VFAFNRVKLPICGQFLAVFAPRALIDANVPALANELLNKLVIEMFKFAVMDIAWITRQIPQE